VQLLVRLRLECLGTHERLKRIGQIKGGNQNIMIRIGFMNDDAVSGSLAC